MTGAKRRYQFSPELQELLRRAYEAPTKRELSARIERLVRLRPGWRRAVWVREAGRLGLTFAEGRRAWTATEDRELLEAAGRRGLSRIAARMGRTEGSVRMRAHTLQMSLRVRDGFSAKDVARCFGVNEHRAAKWIGRGMFGDSVVGEGHTRVSEAGIRKFIRRHADEYDLRRVDQVWFKSVMLGAATWRD